MASVWHDDDSGIVYLRATFSAAGQYLPATGGALETNSGTPADYQVAPSGSVVLGGDVSRYAFTVPVPSTLPVTLDFVIVDIDTNEVRGGGIVRLDASGAETDPLETADDLQQLVDGDLVLKVAAV